MTRFVVWDAAPVVLLGAAVLAGEAAGRDAGCQAAWAAARDRFFAGAGS